MTYTIRHKGAQHITDFSNAFYSNIPGVMRLTNNVALGGTATQSSDDTGYDSSPLASLSIDGNFDTSLTTTNVVCSKTGNTPPVWWQVDLHKVYEINKVAITGRSEYCKSQVTILLQIFITQIIGLIYLFN